MRLHLGCGENYLDGFVNVEHPCNKHMKADLHEDIRDLEFKNDTVDEIIISHVFEHFNRPTALALLYKFNRWLKVGGRLNIVTPDIIGSARNLSSGNFSYTDQQKILRHMFGTHEADWAVHADGWYDKKFNLILPMLGFSIGSISNIRFQNNSWRSDVSVEAFKEKSVDVFSAAVVINDIISQSMIDGDDFAILMNQHHSFSQQVNWGIGEYVGSLEVEIIKNLINNNSVVFDVGCHHGEWSAEVNKLFPNATIHAFDPQEECCKEIKGKLSSINTHRTSVGSDTWPKEFFVYKDHKLNGCSGFYLRGAIGCEADIHVVQCTTLDKFCEENKINRIDLLKIDVEGAEFEVLKGAFNLLVSGRIKAIKFEYGGTFKDSGFTLAETYQYLRSHGFQIFKGDFNGFFHVKNWFDFWEDYNRSDFFAIHEDEIGKELKSITNKKATTIVFSRDRAMQLDLCLKTYLKYCNGESDIQVLYKCSDDIMRYQYLRLTDYYPEVKFYEETSFRDNLMYMLAGYAHVVFVTDDTIFVRDFNLNSGINTLKDDKIIGFSLRLGKNITHCFISDEDQNLPEDYSLNDGIITYEWGEKPNDFGYPLELSSSVYRTDDILDLILRVPFRNPNTLEYRLDGLKYELKRPVLACYETSVAFANPINKVQTEWVSRCGDVSHLHLANQMSFGLRLEDTYGGFIPNSPHVLTTVDYYMPNLVNDDPEISIVIVTYNGFRRMAECFKSILRNTNSKFQTIIIDNSNSPEIKEYFDPFGDLVTLIQSPVNLGPSAGRNLGIPYAKGKYIVFLDDDTVLPRNWDTKFLNEFDKHPEIGFLSCMSNWASGYQMVHHVTYNSPFSFEKFAESFSRYNSGIIKTCRLIGFCFFIKREVIDKIGGLDPTFGKYGYEDDDLSIRAQIAGFSPAVAKGIFIHHTGGPIKNSDPEYMKQLQFSKESFEKKWNVKEEPDGTYDITNVLNQDFDPEKHYIQIGGKL